MAKPEGGRYRKSVDEGRTGDKVKHEDPAAAPLETDAETAGEATPRPSLEEVGREQESIIRAESAQGANTQARQSRWAVLSVLILLLIAIIAIWLSFGAGG